MIGYSFIEPEYRGQGLADLFYAARLEQAQHHLPWTRIVADHRDGNEASRRMLLKHGFNFTEKAMVDWPDGSKGYECRYELSLETLRSHQSAYQS